MYMHMKCLRKVVTSVTTLQYQSGKSTLRSSNIKKYYDTSTEQAGSQAHAKIYHRAGKSQIQQCANA